MKIKTGIFLLFWLSAGLMTGQEVLTGLQVNEVLQQASAGLSAERGCNCKGSLAEPALDLPFFDDFSVEMVYPDQQRWVGYSVFVNKDFAVYPTNIGVATLDAVDSSGAVYKDAVWYPPFVADHLTSRPIRLDSLLSLDRRLTPADSLYLSFYYQPQGRGNEPEPWDTLVLEFGVPSGDSVFARMDSITVLSDLLMMPGQDTIRMFDTLWAPASEGCNPLVYMVNYDPIPIPRGVAVTVLCDSVFEPVTYWEKIWYAEGSKLTEFHDTTGRYFLQVMVPILDTLWFNPQFQFRFINYASIADDIIPTWKSNVDQWNIDYVYLNYSRSAGDTTYRALAFSEGAPSFLRDYQVMPYRQYRADPTNALRMQFEMYIANLDNEVHNTAYEYRVAQVSGSYGYRYNGGNCNLAPFYEGGFQVCDGCGAAHACPPVQQLFNIDYHVDTMSYIIRHYISDSSNENPIVDSAIYHQGFYNYYAYDDGTPELGYGLVPTGASLAYQFSVSMPDTLQGVQMYFNKTLDNANELYFALKVWSNNNGKPGELIYTQENQKVAWSDGGIYHFVPYMLDEPLIVSGTFYVGWEQYTEDNLNIGFDAAHNEQDKIFYNTDGEWYNSSFEGALLMRPMVGSAAVLGEQANLAAPGSLKLYPNPAQTTIHLEWPRTETNDAVAEIYNLPGQRLLTADPAPSTLDISGLSPGMYVVRVHTAGRSYVQKLFINR